MRRSKRQNKSNNSSKRNSIERMRYEISNELNDDESCDSRNSNNTRRMIQNRRNKLNDDENSRRNSRR